MRELGRGAHKLIEKCIKCDLVIISTHIFQVFKINIIMDWTSSLVETRKSCIISMGKSLRKVTYLGVLLKIANAGIIKHRT
jgi:hypothetical protein